MYVLFCAWHWCIWIHVDTDTHYGWLWRLQSLSQMFFLCPVLSGCDLEIRFGEATKAHTLMPWWKPLRFRNAGLPTRCCDPGVVPSHSEWWDLACTRCTEFPLGASISVSSNRDLRMHRGSEWEISWDMQWHNGQVEDEWLNDPANVLLSCEISRPQHSESQRLILETLLVFRLYSKDSLHEVSPVLFKHTKSSPQHIWRRLVLLEKRREIPGSWASLPKDCQTLWILNRLVESLKSFVTCITYDCWAIPLPAPEFLANRKAIHLNTPDDSSCRASTYLDIASFQHDCHSIRRSKFCETSRSKKIGGKLQANSDLKWISTKQGRFTSSESLLTKQSNCECSHEWRT